MLKRFCALLPTILLLAGLPLLAQSADFLRIFGPRPYGPRDRAMVQAQMIYDARAERFDRITNDEFPVEALLLYEEVGLGVPVTWRQKDGQHFVAFPDAKYHRPIFQSRSNAQDSPGTVWRTWHVRSIQEGHCVLEVNPNFPGVLLDKNTENCAALEGK